jgi:uncharacterized membrane protein YhaH (DUF805 family)
VVLVATSEDWTAPAVFLVTVVVFEMVTPLTAERIMVSLTTRPFALVTIVVFSPVTCAVATPLADTSVTVVTLVFMPALVTFWTEEVELIAVVTLVVCPWASPRASTTSAALMKPIASNKY